jgi:hypothetical protein
MSSNRSSCLIVCMFPSNRPYLQDRGTARPGTSSHQYICPRIRNSRSLFQLACRSQNSQLRSQSTYTAYPGRIHQVGRRHRIGSSRCWFPEVCTSPSSSPCPRFRSLRIFHPGRRIGTPRPRCPCPHRSQSSRRCRCSTRGDPPVRRNTRRLCKWLLLGSSHTTHRRSGQGRIPGSNNPIRTLPVCIYEKGRTNHWNTLSQIRRSRASGTLGEKSHRCICFHWDSHRSKRMEWLADIRGQVWPRTGDLRKSSPRRKHPRIPSSRCWYPAACMSPSNLPDLPGTCTSRPDNSYRRSRCRHIRNNHHLFQGAYTFRRNPPLSMDTGKSRPGRPSHRCSYRRIHFGQTECRDLMEIPLSLGNQRRPECPCREQHHSQDGCQCFRECLPNPLSPFLQHFRRIRKPVTRRSQTVG